MTGAASRRRGADAERAVVTWLRNNGHPNVRRHHGADGRAPGDIMGVPGVCIEVKDVAADRWTAWRAQLLAECPDGHIPILVRRVRGCSDVGAWDAEMPWWNWWILTRNLPPVAARVECRRTQQTWVRTQFTALIDATR